MVTLPEMNNLDKYILLRWLYKIGVDIAKTQRESDLMYEELESKVKEDYPYHPLINQSWADDEEPVDLIKKYNLELPEFSNNLSVGLTKHLDVLSDYKGISIRPVRTLVDAYEWYRQFNGKKIVHSLKVDGINTKTIVRARTGEILASASKASNNSNFLDYTEAVSDRYGYLNTKKFEQNNTDISELLVLCGEAYVDQEGVDILREKTGYPYTTKRSAALATLRKNYVNIVDEHLHICAFMLFHNYKTVEQSLRDCRRLGLEVVPFQVTEFVDTGFENFKLWISPIITSLTQIAEDKGIPYDGVVAQVNDMSEYEKDFGYLYNNSNIALKLNETGAEILRTKVTNIKLVQGKKSTLKFSPKLEVEPVKTRNGTVIKEITGYSLKDLVSKNIEVGSDIEIIFQSGTYPTLK